MYMYLHIFEISVPQLVQGYGGHTAMRPQWMTNLRIFHILFLLYMVLVRRWKLVVSSRVVMSEYFLSFCRLISHTCHTNDTCCTEINQFHICHYMTSCSAGYPESVVPYSSAKPCFGCWFGYLLDSRITDLCLKLLIQCRVKFIKQFSLFCVKMSLWQLVRKLGPGIVPILLKYSTEFFILHSTICNQAQHVGDLWHCSF